MSIYNNKRQSGFGAIEIVLIITIIVLVGGVSWAMYSRHHKSTASSTAATTTQTQKTTPATTPTSGNAAAPTTLTNDQIFQEVATQFGLTKAGLVYFRIFGQDKVQYNTGPGTTYAYKTGGKWYIAVKDTQSAVDCSQLSSVPGNYRPGCEDQSTGQLKYTDASGVSINYPPSSAVSYIGQ